jgi:hypothetical protein
MVALRNFIFLILITSFLAFCSSKNKYINSSTWVRIPYNDNFFREKYDKKVKTETPNIIDTNSYYQLEFYIGFFDKVKYYDEPKHIDYIRFYKDGRVNIFTYSMNYSLTKQLPDSIAINFNPHESGYRGVCYKNKDDFFIDFFTQVTQQRAMGIRKFKIVSISKDTLKIRVNEKNSSVYVYSRHTLPSKDLNYNANW